MTVYWLLFGYAALFAMIFPAVGRQGRLGIGQSVTMLGFLVAYLLVAGLRYEIGGDWGNYEDIYDTMRDFALWHAVFSTDPLFGFIMWVSAQLNLGLFLVDAICAGLLIVGTVRIALTTRDPWLALIAATPYLLIVVGMGYIRQAGAIGLILLAISYVGRGNRLAALATMALAPALHITSSILLPVIGRALAPRSRIIGWLLLASGLIIFVLLIQSSLGHYQTDYIESGYDSSGALVRLLMNLLPSLLLLARWKHFPIQGGARTIWFGIAIANILTMIALMLSPSSTAVDRLGLYFSPIQIIVFGSIMDLLKLRPTWSYTIRSLVIVLMAGVQGVWLILATNAAWWVPYHSILDMMAAA